MLDFVHMCGNYSTFKPFRVVRDTTTVLLQIRVWVRDSILRAESWMHDIAAFDGPRVWPFVKAAVFLTHGYISPAIFRCFVI